MRKRLFYGFTVFAMLFTMVTWKYASDELVEIQKPVEEPKNVADRTA